MGHDHDIKAIDGYLLGGVRSVRADGVIFFARQYWQAPMEWAGKRVWVHNLDADAVFDAIIAAPPGSDGIYAARRDGTAVKLGMVGRADAKRVIRTPRWRRKARP